MHNPYLTSNLATGAVVGVVGSALAEDEDLDVHTGILEVTRRRHIAELEAERRRHIAELEAERRRHIREKHTQLLQKPVVINLLVRDMRQTSAPWIRFSTTLCRSDYWRDRRALFSWLVEKVPFDTWEYATVEEQDQSTPRILFPNSYPGSTSVKDECKRLLFGPMLNMQDFDKLYAGAEDSVPESSWLVEIYTQSAELPRIV